jgi:hypothetical protein
MRWLLLVTLLAALAPIVNAQRIVSASPRFTSRFNQGSHPQRFFYPLGFSDALYSDYFSSTGFSVVPQPPAIFMQAPPAAAPVPDRFPSPAEPLMIERQGDRYVQVSGPATSEAKVITAEGLDHMPEAPRRRPHPSGNAIQAAAVPELPAVILVFRDGHREEATEYTIADGVLYLYASSDPYVTGSWNRKIALAALNLPETVETNRSRGVRFQLPTAPNEVIVRP